jgi:hypothetical protein
VWATKNVWFLFFFWQRKQFYKDENEPTEAEKPKPRKLQTKNETKPNQATNNQKRQSSTE